MQLVVDALPELRLAVVVLHDVEPRVDGLLILQREHEPAAQQPAAHGRHRAVYHVEQALAVVLHRMHQLEASDGELVEPDVLILLDARDAGDVGYLRVLCLLKVLQDGPGGNHAVLQVIHAEALHILHAEVLQQLRLGRLLGEHPVVELKGEVLVAELLLKVFLAVAVVQYLLGREVAEQLLHVVAGALAGEKLSCGDVEEGHAAGRLSEVYGSQEVVLLIVQHVVGEGHARRHQLGDAPLDELLGQLRVLQLVADGHALAGADELGQIGVEGVMWKSGHLVALHPCPVVAVGQRDAQYPGRRHGVLAVGLIEVAAAEEHQRVGVLRLQVEELFHHRGQLPVFLCHPILFYLMVRRDPEIAPLCQCCTLSLNVSVYCLNHPIYVIISSTISSSVWPSTFSTMS